MSKLYVGGLNYDTDRATLTAAFATCGKLRQVLILREPESGRSRGFGFVTFSSPREANNAVEKMDGVEIDGRNIRVNLCMDKNSTENGRGSNTNQSSSFTSYSRDCQPKSEFGDVSSNYGTRSSQYGEQNQVKPNYGQGFDDKPRNYDSNSGYGDQFGGRPTTRRTDNGFEGSSSRDHSGSQTDYGGNSSSRSGYQSNYKSPGYNPQFSYQPQQHQKQSDQPQRDYRSTPIKQEDRGYQGYVKSDNSSYSYQNKFSSNYEETPGQSYNQLPSSRGAPAQSPADSQDSWYDLKPVQQSQSHSNQSRAAPSSSGWDAPLAADT